MPLSTTTLENLAASGITPETAEAANILDPNVDPDVGDILTRLKAKSGYYIPYPNLDGSWPNGAIDKRHYRMRILEPIDRPKYIQPKRSGNRLYVPPVGLPEDWATDPDVPLFITEGEKKALAAGQAQVPTVAVGGVYSWRSHVFKFPRAAVSLLKDTGSSTLVGLDSSQAKLLGEEVIEEFGNIEWKGRQVWLVFDSDAAEKPQVQQACVDLADFLETKGAVVRQVDLPDGAEKVGMDDFLLDHDAADTFLDPDWLQRNSAVPLPHDPAEYLSGLLNAGRVPRSVAEKAARFAISVLDDWGKRFRDEAGGYYFFDTDTRELHEFPLDMPRLRETSFGRMLQTELGLATGDSNVMGRFADKFSAGAEVTTPHRVVANKGDAVYYQVSDSRLAKVTATGVELVDNGTDDMLFLAGQTEPLDEDELLAALAADLPEKPRWLEAFEDTNLQAMQPLFIDQTQKLLTTLFYLSPWLYRWRGTMFPLEVAVAEPNSGKTFLYNLRLGILSGRPGLSGLPDDFKGWVSAISQTGGMWVCDNLGSLRNDYGQRFADEIARLVTEPEPTVDLRQLYTTNTVRRIPVQASFAVTTIRNPLTQPDVLQRSLVFNMLAIPAGQRRSNWYTGRMKERVAWVAEHLLMLADFFALVEDEWVDDYASGHRLVNFEQAIGLMGRVLGFNLTATIKQLPSMVTHVVATNDPVIEGFVTFADEWKKPTARLRDIVTWAELDEDHRFSALKTFDNVIMLGRYMASHAYDIAEASGIVMKRVNNKTVLVVREEPDE